MRGHSRKPAAVAAATLLALSLGCTSQAPAPASPAPAPGPAVPSLPAVQQPAPVQLPPVALGPHLANVAFIESLLGTMQLGQVVAPQALADYTQDRTWTSSAIAGSQLLEAWTEATPGGSQVEAMAFDPASASYHVLGLPTTGTSATAPAIAGGSNGSTMIMWATQDSGSGQPAIVGQVFDSGGQTGTRWDYRHGSGSIGDTALAPTSNGFVGLWTEADNGNNLLLDQAVDAQGSPQGNPTVISTIAGTAKLPAVAVGSSGMLAAWAQTVQSQTRIYGHLLDANGQPQGSDFPISDGGGTLGPKVAWDGKQYWVSWYDGRAGLAGAYDAYAQAVTTAGGLQGSNIRVSSHRMVPSGVAPRVVPDGNGEVVVFSGQAIDDQDSTALAPSALYASMLSPGATPSAPFAISPIASASLVDAQSWGADMVVLDEQATGSQTALNWSLLSIPGAPNNSFNGSAYPYGQTSGLGTPNYGVNGNNATTTSSAGGYNYGLGYGVNGMGVAP